MNEVVRKPRRVQEPVENRENKPEQSKAEAQVEARKEAVKPEDPVEELKVSREVEQQPSRTKINVLVNATKRHIYLNLEDEDGNVERFGIQPKYQTRPLSNYYLPLGAQLPSGLMHDVDKQEV